MPLDQQGFVLPETKPTTRELPDKLSDLILVSLEDLERAEAASKYSVEMHVWHSPKGDLCIICLAGSVMAFSLGADPGEDILPCTYSDYTYDRLRALNMVRGGDISLALKTIDPRGHKHSFPHEDMVSYGESPRVFKAQLRSIASRLVARGY